MTALRIAVLAPAIALAAMFAYVVASRVAFPYELEWMCGSILDHVQRAREGLPIYAAPTTAWIPYLYPPLFYWVGAIVGGSPLACRLVSLAAALVQAACVGRLAQRGGASRFWTAIAVLLFFGAFFYVGYWYDVERSDTLCVALVLVAAVILTERATIATGALAGLVLGVAFFAKQQALPFAVASALALAIDRQWKAALALGATTAIVVAGITRWLDAATAGWFGHYVFALPAAHGIDARLWHDVWIYDVPRGAVLLVVTIGLCARLLADARAGDRRHLLFALLLGTGGVVALSSRLHVGGWINVLQPWASFACPAVAIAATRAEAWLATKAWRAAGVALVHGAVVAQIALWVHSPRHLELLIPDASLRADTEAFLADVHRLERDGDVLVVGRGHVTRAMHFQMSGLADVTRVDGAPADLLDALRARRLAAIVDDARVPGGPELGLWPPVMLEDVTAAKGPLFANYYVAERLDDRELRLVMPAPAMPRWVYRPRKEPLAESDPSIARRHLAELALAERHAPPDAIEALAAREAR